MGTPGFASIASARQTLFEFYEDHVLDTSRHEIPGSEIILAFPFAVLSAATYVSYYVFTPLRSVRLFSHSDTRPAKPQTADDTRAKTHVWMRASWKHTGTIAYIRPATLEMESVPDMLRPMHFVSDFVCLILGVDNARFIFFVGSFCFSHVVTCVSIRVFLKARNVNRERRVQSTCPINVIHVAGAQLFQLSLGINYLWYNWIVKKYRDNRNYQ